MSAPLDIEAEVEKATTPPWESRISTVTEEWYSTPPPPRRWLLRDARKENRDGVLPLGKVGLLAAAGGVGKTTANTQLTLAVASGTTWLGAFEVATMPDRLSTDRSEFEGDSLPGA